MLDVKALLAKIIEKQHRPIYYASASTTITSTDIDTRTNGASVTLPGDGRNYLIVAHWVFNTRTTTGTTNSQVAIHNGTALVASQRMFAAAANYNTMECAYITNAMTADTTYTVQGSSSRPTNGAQPNWIRAIALN